MHLRDMLDDALGTAFAEHPDAGVLAVALSDNEWAWVQDEFPNLNPATLKRAVDSLARARRTYATPRRARSMGSSRTRRRVSVRDHAVTAVVAHDARHERSNRFGIAAFHRNVLGSRLLAVEEVKAWIERQRRAQGPVRPDTWGSRTTDTGVQVPLLAWADPETGWTSWVATKRGTVLDHLRRISEALTRFYGWLPAEATFFVLTGRAPLHQAIRATVRHRVPMRVRSRVVLEIDPMSTPADVAAEYRRVRRLHFGPRLRRLSEKHAHLAIFQLVNADLPAPEALATWNRAFPAFRYTSLAAFRRDCRQAVIRAGEMSLRPIAPKLP